MQLQPGICPFPVYRDSGVKHHAIRRYHGSSSGFTVPYQLSRLSSDALTARSAHKRLPAVVRSCRAPPLARLGYHGLPQAPSLLGRSVPCTHVHRVGTPTTAKYNVLPAHDPWGPLTMTPGAQARATTATPRASRSWSRARPRSTCSPCRSCVITRGHGGGTPHQGIY